MGNEEANRATANLKAALREPMVFIDPVILKEKPDWMSQEFFELHNKIQERAIICIASVKEMIKHPFTLEQAREQVRRLNAE